MSLENETRATRFFEEVWNQRRGETIEELIDPEAECLPPVGTAMRGANAFRERVYGPWLSAFPDIRLTVEGTVAEGDQVVVRWTMTGTHTGEGLGLPPSGRAVNLRGMTWIRYENGKMREGWDCFDSTGLMQSLQVQ
jgi:steroid delta-isomerase-like uncharacterized protein